MQRAPGGAYRPPPRTAPPPPPPPPPNPNGSSAAPNSQYPPPSQPPGTAPAPSSASAAMPSSQPHQPQQAQAHLQPAKPPASVPSQHQHHNQYQQQQQQQQQQPPHPSSGPGHGAANTTNPRPSPLSPSSASPVEGLPDAPTRFPELDALPLSELRLLDAERDKFDDFVKNHAHTRRVEDVLSAVRRDVKSVEQQLADRDANAANGPPDESERTRVAEQIATLRGDVARLEAQRDQWLEHNSPDRLMDRLRVAIREAEAESDRLEQDMLAETIVFDDFLKQYIAVRKKYHERALKLEQLKYEEKRNIPYAR